MAHREGLLGLFTYVDDFLFALRGLTSGARKIETVFSPLYIPEIDEILAKRPSRARLITLLGGIGGGLGLLGLAIYAHLSFSLITSGKPVLPWVPWVIVCFEGTILGGVLASVAAWIFLGRLPRRATASGYDPVFSQDRFGVLVACSRSEQEEIRKLLKESGAGEVRNVAW
ncbi:MAG TPA: quinol:electron acceptor oxidoreductase subunit ActD [Syntrophorhabdaceae bacterium]|nr:quinol:electron acceptor oxidoreductase subunit ActD [Syntrophorhabdaceae bacterium]